MSKVCTLFSGSSGNTTYISSGSEGLLIDAGVSCKKILTALSGCGVDCQSIHGIFITHSHTDHIQGLRVLLGKLKVPVIATAQTLEQLSIQQCFAPGQPCFAIDEGDALPLDMKVCGFQTSHDCPGSSGYVVTLKDGEKVALCTDLGYVSDTVRQAITGCKMVILESNHDVGMLQNGVYPFSTKQRILSDEGHLSNVSCAIELPELVGAGASHLVLAHLSRENNTPDIARVTASSVLLEHGMQDGRDYTLYVAPASGGKMFYL